MRKGNGVRGPNSRIPYALIYLALFLSLGHHIDHALHALVAWRMELAQTVDARFKRP